MKKFFKYFLIVLLFSITILATQKHVFGYTSNEKDFQFTYLERQSKYNVFSQEDKHYISLSSSDLKLHASNYDEYDNGGVTKITGILNKLIIKDERTNKIILDSTSNYVIIDGTNAFYGEYVLIQTKDDTFIWNFRELAEIIIYFEGVIDYHPTIDGEEALIVDIDNPISAETIKSYYRAYDDYDGDLTDEIFIVEDNYTNNLAKPGNYELLLGVSDSSGNESRLLILIYVIDIAPPTIIGDFSKVIISYDEVFDLDTFYENLVVEDNYINELTLEIHSNTYTANKEKVGKYEIVFTATDTSGNKTTKVKEIEVVDLIKPIITGPENISKSINEYVPIEDITILLTAYDDYDGDLTSKIIIKEDNYTNQMYQKGSKSIIYEVSDESGNKGYFEVIINIIDQEKPLFYVSNQVVITTPLSYHLTEEMILNILNNHQLFKNSIIEIKNVDFNKYNATEVGVYRINLDYVSTNNTVNKLELLVNVYNPTTYEDNDDIINNDNKLIIYIISSISLLLISFGVVVVVHIKQKRW